MGDPQALVELDLIVQSSGETWRICIERAPGAVPTGAAWMAKPVDVASLPADARAAADRVLRYIAEHGPTLPWFDRERAIPKGGCRQARGETVEYMITPQLLQSLAGPGMTRQTTTALRSLDALRLDRSGKTSHSIRALTVCRVYILKHDAGAGVLLGHQQVTDK